LFDHGGDMELPAAKVYVVDTNVLVMYPQVIDELHDNVIVVPFWVLEELDGLKRSKPALAHAVRIAARNIERYRLKGVAEGSNFEKGIRTDGGGLLIFDHNAIELRNLGFPVKDTVDNRVLLVAKHWKELEEKTRRGLNGAARPVIVLTQDILLKVKASTIGIEAQDWQSDRLVPDVEAIYTGMGTFEIKPEQEILMTQLHQDGSFAVADLGDEYDLSSLMPNQCLTLTWREGSTTALAIYKKAEGRFVQVKKSRGKGRDWQSNIRPINDEQQYAYELLKDESVELVSLTGVAGTGKTLMALLAGYEQVKKNRYSRILVWRSTQVVGDGLGFYPGTLEEKFSPYARPVMRAFQKIVGAGDEGAIVDYDKAMVTSGLITVEPILHVQGSTEDNVFLIIDEAQNLTPNEIRALITRAGLGTKIVLTGDVRQVENRFLDELSNGLTFTVERWRGSERSGHVGLVKAERSPLVEEAALLMG
jgi:PhoH-like ATPase